MHIRTFKFPGLIEIVPKQYYDDRGYFHETFNKGSFDKYGIPSNFHQDNESFSKKNVLRGLHFQKPPYAQGKLIRVIKGKVLDVVVDLRKNSPTFKKWMSFELDDITKHIIYVPKGFAHGFYTLEDGTIFSYKCTDPYNKSAETGVHWKDPELNILWGATDPILADRDAAFPPLSEALQNF